MLLCFYVYRMYYSKEINFKSDSVYDLNSVYNYECGFCQDELASKNICKIISIIFFRNGSNAYLLIICVESVDKK